MSLNNEQAEAILERATNGLMEHFEAVQILVTWTDEKGDTFARVHGAGNWYSRVGMATEMIEREKAKIHGYVQNGQ